MFRLACVAALICGVILVVWLSWGHRSPPPSVQSQRVVLFEDSEVWVKELEQGGEVEFQRDSAEPSSSSLEPSPAGKLVQTIGLLSAVQKGVALERLGRFLLAAENRYRHQGVGTLEDDMRSLQEAYDVVLYEVAMQMVREDRVWAFVRGRDDLKTAWRNVPRGWRKMRVNNVASTDTGQMIDIIVAVDPGVNPAIQSIIDQMGAVSQMSAIDQASRK